jgi:hypothetical protein
MNDEQLQDFSIIAFSEPHSFVREDIVMTVPLSHTYWTKMIPCSESAVVCIELSLMFVSS